MKNINRKERSEAALRGSVSAAEGGTGALHSQRGLFNRELVEIEV
jgi:hypothetical protein